MRGVVCGIILHVVNDDSSDDTGLYCTQVIVVVIDSVVCLSLQHIDHGGQSP